MLCQKGYVGSISHTVKVIKIIVQLLFQAYQACTKVTEQQAPSENRKMIQ
jgi:hypothetical protein